MFCMGSGSLQDLVNEDRLLWWRLLASSPCQTPQLMLSSSKGADLDYMLGVQGFWLWVRRSLAAQRRQSWLWAISSTCLEDCRHNHLVLASCQSLAHACPKCDILAHAVSLCWHHRHLRLVHRRSVSVHASPRTDEEYCQWWPLGHSSNMLLIMGGNFMVLETLLFVIGPLCSLNAVLQWWKCNWGLPSSCVWIFQRVQLCSLLVLVLCFIWVFNIVGPLLRLLVW